MCANAACEIWQRYIDLFFISGFFIEVISVRAPPSGIAGLRGPMSTDGILRYVEEDLREAKRIRGTEIVT